MILFFSLLFALALVYPIGGSYGQLARSELRGAPFFGAGLMVQLVLTSVLGSFSYVHAPTLSWVLGALLLLIGCGMNAGRTGFVVAGIGVTLNLLVIMFNAGMPVDESALVLISGTDGYRAVVTGSIYHFADEATRLRVLADVVPVPGPRGVRSVASIGDLFLCVGVAAGLLEMATGNHGPEDDSGA